MTEYQVNIDKHIQTIKAMDLGLDDNTITRLAESMANYSGNIVGSIYETSIVLGFMSITIYNIVDNTTTFADNVISAIDYLQSYPMFNIVNLPTLADRVLVVEF